MEKPQDDEARSRERNFSGGMGKEERIQVSVRLRPLNSKELARNDQSDWECINDTTIIFRNILPERSMFPSAYSFDRVFRHDCDTKRVYEEGAKEVALSVLSGINASVFAYGQTSSGKTYTMTGITEYAMADIYDYIEVHKERQFVLKFSALEIYNEAVRDLLSADSTPLRLLDDPDKGTMVEKLTEEVLRDWGHMQELLSICEAQRQIGETTLNETSSRSHQILRLSIESFTPDSAWKDNSSSLAACVNFVDLAGSERASQTLSAGTRLKEGCHINRSLLTLGTVIRKLSKGRGGHVPYRDSKLTRILQSSLGGNARTAIICTMSPARSHVEQSRNTLLFACCAKEVATSAQVNVVMSDKALVKHLQRELARLEAELKCTGLPNPSSYSEALLREKDAQILKMETELTEVTRQRDLAQSQLNDWIRASGEDRESQQSGESGQHSMLHGFNNLEDELFSLYECSSLNDYGFIYSDDCEDTHGGVAHDDGFLGVNLSKSLVSLDRKGQEENCREVRCIETDEILNNGNLATSANHRIPKQTETERADDLLEKKKNAVESSPWLIKSKTCRASPETKWLPEDQYTPRSLPRDLSEKERPRTLPPLLNSGDGNQSPQRKSISTLEPTEGIKSINNLMGMAHNQSQIMRTSGQAENNKDSAPVLAELLNWPAEFERRQWEIIKLWDICNVSLVHRTYFFVLFKGDLADSIYLEVELRRLFFLRRVFTEGGVDKVLAKNGLKLNAAMSIRALRQERDMLSQKLQKRLSAQERERLYQKWGIPLHSKQRKTQLSRLLWSNASNMDHIKESASVVATLVGLLEPNQALKEMFQLSFMPRRPPTRSQSWRHGMSSLI